MVSTRRNRTRTGSFKAGMVLALAAAMPLPLAASPDPGAPRSAREALPVLGPKPFIAYFKPTPIVKPLSRTAWGAAEVGPRDTGNGLEDVTMTQWNYWDGPILRGSDGRYRMFASRWDQARGHNAWWQSKAVTAVSKSLFGPYRDVGLNWPSDRDGLGHNVTPLRMPDGRYAIVVSETRNGDVFVSASIDGPWRFLGSIAVDQSKYRSVFLATDMMEKDATPKPWRASNVSIITRPDGAYEIVQRSGQILLSKKGILGPYEVTGRSIFIDLPGLPQKRLDRLEDPTLWFSGGWYHMLVNHWEDRRAYHLISRDGITGWRFQGLAYEPESDFIRYTDGTVNHWNKLERPAVVIEHGHVKALTFAVIDTPKESQTGNNGHGSKVIVVPFDGAAMDRDLARVDR